MILGARYSILGGILPGPPVETMTVNLLELKVHEQGVIHRLEGTPRERQQLQEMGFVPGSPITYLMPTAFADPRVYQLRGATLALRLSDARKILVRHDSSSRSH